MSKARIAVVGAGLIGRKHIDVLLFGSPDYELAGVADTSPAAAEEGSDRRYALHASLNDLLSQEKPDGVIIAAPNQLHASLGLECIRAGLPILIEKPVADTLANALELIEAAEAAGVPTLTGHHRRHNPIMRRAAELIRDGRIGRPVTAAAMWLAHKPKGYHDLAWRREPGGGPVLINAIHDIDCLRMLLGDIAAVQAAQSNAVRGFAVEDTAAAILTFKSGALGTLLLSDAVSSPWSWETTSGENPAFPRTGQDAILIGGTKGSLAIPSLDVRWYEPGHEDWLEPLTERRERITPADPYVEQMRNFANVIRGTEAPVLTGRDGTITLATTLAITQSAKTGRPVAIDDLIAAPGTPSA
jgi:predicted dehydrogenase